MIVQLQKATQNNTTGEHALAPNLQLQLILICFASHVEKY